MTTICLFEQWILADTKLTFGEWMDERLRTQNGVPTVFQPAQNVAPDYGKNVAQYIGPSADTATPAELAKILSMKPLANSGPYSNKRQP